MKMNRQHFFYTLLLIIAVSVRSVSSFSSRPRKSSRRGRRGLPSSSPLTTRRVFGFTLAGGAHKMFSTMRHPANAKEVGASSTDDTTQPSTSLNYRTSDDFEENYQIDSFWQTAMTDLSEHVDMTTEVGWRQALAVPCSLQEEVTEVDIAKAEKESETKDSELLQTMKAFMPVVIEIGIVAAVASAQRR